MMTLGCPDAPVLAAFAEGTLDPKQRAEVEHHIAHCPECPVVVGEVTRFLAETKEDEIEEAEPPPPTRHAWWWYIAATLAGACIALASWRTLRDPMRGVRRIAAESPVRLFEGRLHGFAYAPFEAPRDAGPPPAPPVTFVAEARRLAGRDSRAAAVLHARGIVALLANDPRGAARLLTLAAGVAPRDSVIWNDLATAEIARAAIETDDRRVLAVALDAADRAVALSPSSPDAQFNRALALELLDRDAEAVDAWRTLQKHEPSPAWRAEIESHLQRLGNTH